MTDKLLQYVGGAVVILALLAGWQYLLESTRSPALKSWHSCKTRILESWAGSHPDHVKAVLSFASDHAYSFGGESPSDSFNDRESRGTAVSDAKELGISESELIQLDQRVAKDCGPFPKSKWFE